MENKLSALKKYLLCEELIAWMVENRTIDGMVTRLFIDEYLQLCEEKGIENVIPDNAISIVVKKHGFNVGNKKIMGNKWRIFIKQP